MLELLHYRAPSAVKHSWTPFESSEGYDHPQWWSDAGGAVGDPWFVEVTENGADVARVQLDNRGLINPAYLVPQAAIHAELLEIQFFEVRSTARRRNIGTKVVQILAEQYPDRQLMAYSKDADAFWGSLADWERFDDPDRPSKPLFLQQHRQTTAM